MLHAVEFIGRAGGLVHHFANTVTKGARDEEPQYLDKLIDM